MDNNDIHFYQQYTAAMAKSMALYIKLSKILRDLEVLLIEQQDENFSLEIIKVLSVLIDKKMNDLKTIDTDQNTTSQ